MFFSLVFLFNIITSKMSAVQYLTCKTMALISSGLLLHRAPARTPPALAAASAVYFGWENPSSCSSMMQALRSLRPLSLLCWHPSLCQLWPSSPPPLEFKIIQVGSFFQKEYRAKLQIVKDSSSHRITKTWFAFPNNFSVFLSLPSLTAKIHNMQRKKKSLHDSWKCNSIRVF